MVCKTMVCKKKGSEINDFKSFVWLLVILFFLLVGCQSKPTYQAYSGEAKSDKEVTTFVVPDDFDLLYVDGRAYAQSFLIDGVIVKMMPGPHQIVVQYNRIWAIPPDSHEKVVSQPLRLSFSATAGNTYSIGFEELQELKDARLFAKNPSVQVKNVTMDQTVSAEIEYQLHDESFLASFIGKIASNDNPQKPPASGDMTSEVQSQQAQPTNKDARALDMLKYWWQQADSQQRNDFKQWLENQ